MSKNKSWVQYGCQAQNTTSEIRKYFGRNEYKKITLKLKHVNEAVLRRKWTVVSAYV